MSSDFTSDNMLPSLNLKQLYQQFLHQPSEGTAAGSHQVCCRGQYVLSYVPVIDVLVLLKLIQP